MQQVQTKIYFDNASTTKVNEEVLNSYKKLLDEHFANSESLYDSGTIIRDMIEKSRKSIASFFGVSSDCVIFTSGASESNNLAIKGVCFNNLKKKHIITSSIEHSSVFNTIMQLKETFEYDVTVLDVDNNGAISLDDLKNSLKDDTVLVSIMAVNNEVGSINPINEIADIVKKYSRAFLHVDMVQALGKVDINLKNIDLASFSAHKIEGLKGSGILIKKQHVKLKPLICAGQQEFGLRGGTSNALVNILFYKTLRLYFQNKNDLHIENLNKLLINELKKIPEIKINSPSNSVKNIVNFSCDGIFSEIMLNALNKNGIMVSAQSTCSSKSGNPSHVLKAMGFDDLRSNSCIRVSFSRFNTEDEIYYFISTLKEIIKKYGSL